MIIAADIPRNLPAQQTPASTSYRLKAPLSYNDLIERRDLRIAENFATPLDAIVRRSRAFQGWSANWNDHGCAAPNPASIAHAIEWITQLHNDVQSVGTLWLEPHVVPDQEGNIAFEWWHNDKTLTIYVEPHGAEYIQAWGANIFTEMNDGAANTSTARKMLWQCLLGETSQS